MVILCNSASSEEGLYRLSGSSSTIQNLRYRFDTEGDVNLLDADFYYDVHAISGLFKLFLRELSEPILSKELRMEFFQITGSTMVNLSNHE
jgi:RhoGAP domain